MRISTVGSLGNIARKRPTSFCRSSPAENFIASIQSDVRITYYSEEKELSVTIGIVGDAVFAPSETGTDNSNIDLIEE